MDKEVMGLRSTNRWLQNSHGDAKYGIGNGAAKELLHMTHEHKRWCGDCLREWGGAGWRGAKGENQDDSSSIINKI